MNPSNINSTSFLPYDHVWVEEQLKKLTLKEKIAQLLIVAVNPELGMEDENKVLDNIQNYGVGGLIFMTGDPQRQIDLTNKYQQASKVPLLIVMDAEWGPAMRLEQVLKFPYSISLGAMPDEKYIYEMAREIGCQLKNLGVHVNFAPVVDINTNPLNKAIGYRSVGEERENVLKKCRPYIKGLHDEGILAVIKHFPGHGDAQKDSHAELPDVLHSRERLDEIELYPFKELIKEGVKAVMVAHLYMPALDSSEIMPSSLSKKIITGLLKNELGFEGLVISDALDMKGVSDYAPPGVCEVKALQAGNDILEMCRDTGLAIESIYKAVKNGEITKAEIDEKCRKVLVLKYWAGLHKKKLIKNDVQSLDEALNSKKSKLIDLKLKKRIITLLRNSNNIIPLDRNHSTKIASVSIGSSEITAFQLYLGNYKKTDNYILPSNFTALDIYLLSEKLGKYDLIIAGIHNLSVFIGDNFGISSQIEKIIAFLNTNFKTIFVIFGNPYSLGSIKNIETAHGLILTFEGLRSSFEKESLVSQEIAADIIFGKIKPVGKLPVTINEHFKAGDGITE
jgi:beta-glucosidase-like glycosyl hydrolase